MIVNPVAGHGLGKRTGEALIARLKEKKAAFEALFTEYKGHAAELARSLCQRDDCQALCAVGGDGTFYEVLSGLDTRVPLSLIPAGTGNDFVRGAGLERDPMKALDMMLEGTSHAYDYIMVNDRRCLNAAGLGFDIDVLENESRFRKIIHNRSSYYFALIKSLLRFSGRRGHVVLDGETEVEADLFLLSMMNGKYIGGGMPLSLSSQADDGVMDVILVRMMPRYLLPRMLYKYLKGRIQEETEYVSVYHCSRVSCRVEPASRVQLDGEIQDLMPVDVRLVKGGLKLFGRSA